MLDRPLLPVGECT